MAQKNWRIIINPTSGTQRKDKLLEQIKKHLTQARVNYEFAFTKGPSHATELAREAAELGTTAVIAVGGDGTVNETACGLLHSNTALGILPVGSGNGLGRHLKIPLQPEKALQCLLQCEVMKMDVCTANDHPFLNVAGVGYDALVAHEFAMRPQRGFHTYARTVLEHWFKYKPKTYQLEVEGQSLTRKALMVTMANGSQYGNNAFIAPNARIDDGLMDICVLRGFPASAIPFVAYRLFSKAITDSRYTEFFRVSEFQVTQKSKKVHLDGEPYKLGKEIHFKVLPGSLNVLVPADSLLYRSL